MRTRNHPTRRCMSSLARATSAFALSLGLVAATSGGASAQGTDFELVPGEERAVRHGDLLQLLEILPTATTTIQVGPSNTGAWSESVDLTGDGRLSCAVVDGDLLFTAGEGEPVSDSCFARVCSLPLGGLLTVCTVTEFDLSLVTCRESAGALDAGCDPATPACDIDADSGERTCVGCTSDVHCGGPDGAIPVVVGQVTTVTSSLLHRLLGLDLLAPLSDISVRGNVNEPFGDSAVIGTDLTCSVVDGDVVVEAGAQADATGTCFVQACLLDSDVCLEIPLDVLVDLCLVGGECNPYARCDVDNNTCLTCIDDRDPGAIDSGCLSSTPACAADGETATCVECTTDADCEAGLLAALVAPGGESLLSLNEILEFLRLSPTLVPSDVKVSSSVDGVFSDEALLTSDVDVANCAVNADGDVVLSGIAAEGNVKCYVEVCLDLVGGTVESCVVAPIDVRVDACVLSGTCHVEPSCLEGNVCGDCRDTNPAGDIDRGCDHETPACLAATCVECIEDVDCNQKFPLIDLDLGEEGVIGRDLVLASLGLIGAVDASDLLVSATIDGGFGDSALLDVGAETAQCTVNPNGDINLVASSTVYGEVICYVQACVSALGVNTCLVAPITLNVDPCASRGDCQPPICGAGNRCQECADAGDGVVDPGCGEVNPACLEDVSGMNDSLCVECTADADCDSGVCDTEANRCVACRDDMPADAVDTGCDEVNPACDETDPSEPRCVPCLDNGEGALDEGCSVETPACLTTETEETDGCVECTDDADCDVADVCDGTINECVDCRDDAADGVMDMGCDPETPVCNEEEGQTPICVSCVDDTVGGVDTGCGTDLPACDEAVESGLCRECTVNPDCPMNHICDLTSYTCVEELNNNAPVAEDVTTTTPEDVAVLVPLADFISDADGDTFSIRQIATAPTRGVATVSGETNVLYTPFPDYNGPDIFTYLVCDARNACSEGVVRVEVTPVNDGPRAFDDVLELKVNVPGAADVLANDIDPDGDMLMVESVMTMSDSITVSIDDDGMVAVSPAQDFEGVATASYTACDPSGACESAVLTVYVGEVAPEQPMVMADEAETDAGAMVDIDVLANDVAPEGQTLSVAAWSQPARGVVVATTDGKLRYYPAPGHTGTDSFRYAACTGDARCGAATVTVTTNESGDNRAPVAVDDEVFTRVDAAVTFDPTTNDIDPDGDALTVESFTAPMHGTLERGDDNNLVYTPEAGYIGSDMAEITIADPDGLTATSTVKFTVTETGNTPPVAADDNFTMEPGVETVVDVLANDSDPDGDPLTIVAITQPGNGTVDFAEGEEPIAFGFVPRNGGNAQKLVVTLAPNIRTTARFTYTISDGQGGFATGRVLVTPVISSGEVVANNDVLTVDEDTAGDIDVLANDAAAPGRTLRVSQITVPAQHGAAVIGQSGVVLYTPMANYFGNDTFTYEACDDLDSCDTATVLVTVNPAADAPNVNDDRVTVLTDSANVIDVLANDFDVDGETLTITRLTSDASHGTLTVLGNGTALSYSAPGDWLGETTASYEACDPTGLCGEATVTIEVVADPVGGPEAKDDGATTMRNVPVTILPLENDVSSRNMTLAIDWFDQANPGEVWRQGEALNFVPVTDWTGVARFKYGVCDAIGRCAEATITVVVLEGEEPNGAPIAMDDSFVVDAGAAATLDVLANDTDPNGDGLTIQSVTGATRGTLSVTGDGKVLFTPSDATEFEDIFTYTVCDAGGLCDEGTVRVTFKAATEDPALMVKGGPNCGAGDSPAWPATVLLLGLWLVLRRRAIARRS